jgi:hypothetical protein
MNLMPPPKLRRFSLTAEAPRYNKLIEAGSLKTFAVQSMVYALNEIHAVREVITRKVESDNKVRQI